MALPNNQQGSRNGVTQYKRGTFWKTPAQQVETPIYQWQQFDDETDQFGYYNFQGSPEGNVPANIGSYCSDTTNGNIYVKTTDTVPTGWKLLQTQDLHVAKWIVNPTPNAGGNSSTIQNAINQAVAGETIFVTPGTYTENLTLKPGVNIVAFNGDQSTPNVTIVGNATLSSAGTVSITGIRLQTNGAAFLTVSGSAASIVNLNNCYLNCANATGISLTSSSGSSFIYVNYCQGNIGTTGISLFAVTGAGTLQIDYTFVMNSGGTSTASTISAGVVTAHSSEFRFPVTSSGTGQLGFIYCSFITTSQNTTCITHGSSTISSVRFCRLESGTASTISVGAGSTLLATGLQIASSNANAVTGAGTINYSSLLFTSTSSTINTTTQTAQNIQLGKYQASGQPAFLATHTVAQDNVTGAGTSVTVNFTTEVFDQNSNYNGTNTFTAPTTGKYSFNASVRFDQLTAAMTQGQISFVTSNRSYVSQVLSFAAIRIAGDVVVLSFSILADMDAADTCIVQVNVANGAGDTVDLPSAATQTYFSGMLQC